MTVVIFIGAEEEFKIDWDFLLIMLIVFTPMALAFGVGMDTLLTQREELKRIKRKKEWKK